MRKTLNVFFALQIVFGAIWFFGVLATGNQGWGALYFFIGTYWLQGIAVLVAFWALWRHPPDRRMALLMLALPVVLLFLPGIIVDLVGGPLSATAFRNLSIAAAIALLVVILIAPRTVADFLPDFLYQSKGLNVTILVMQLLGWLIPAAALLWLLFSTSHSGGGADTDAPAWIVGYFILFGGLYSAFFVLMSFGTTLHAYISLRTGTPYRKLHIGQLAASSPAILAFGWLAVTMFRLTGQY